jgi:DNA modification methylase
MMETLTIGNATILQGNCLDTLKQLEAESVQCCITSPPYFGLRDYGADGQIGLEGTPEEFTEKLVEVFREVRRVLRNDGTLWLNLGDSFNAAGRTGHGTRQGYKQGTNRASATKADNCRPSVDWLKPKDLIGIPWMVAFALRADGWYLRSDIIWSKPNPMPESVTDRPTKAHEYLFLLSKFEKYHYDHEAIKERATYADCGRPSKVKGDFEDKGEPLPGRLAFRAITETRNKRSVWEIATQPFSGAHFATFPPKLIEPCILAGAREGDTILDPFNGSGTTGIVALKHGRKYIGCELNPEYVAITLPRIEEAQSQLKLALCC